MKTSRSARTFLLASIAMLLTTSALATGISGILVIENKSKGRHYSIMVKPDGTFETPELPVGSYEFRFEAKQNPSATTQKGVTTIPPEASVEISYSQPPIDDKTHVTKDKVTNDREKSAGAVKYKNIVLKRGLVNDAARWGDVAFTSSSIAIDEPGIHLTGTITIKNPNGKTMAVDDWVQTK